ncbi:MAG: gamma-glutamyl-phosphate reductase, partial [Spirulina sp.]
MVALESVTPTLTDIARETRDAARHLAVLSTKDRNEALEAIAKALSESVAEIQAANLADCERAEKEGIPKALYARLKLGETKLNAAIAGVREVGKLVDPVG